MNCCNPDCGCAGLREADECALLPTCPVCLKAQEELDADAERRFLQPIGIDRDGMARIMRELKR